MEHICYVRVWCHVLDTDQKELEKLISRPIEDDFIPLIEASALTVADTLGISLEQLTRRPTPRDLRGGKMASLAQKAGQEAARRKAK